MDILLSKDTHDCIWINGKTPVTGDRVDVVSQRLGIKLRSFLGEWFINTLYGIPYWQRILGHKARKEDLDLIFQTAILEEQGVKEITFYSSTFANRIYSVSFRVRVTTGDETQLITITPNV